MVAGYFLGEDHPDLEVVPEVCDHTAGLEVGDGLVQHRLALPIPIPEGGLGRWLVEAADTDANETDRTARLPDLPQQVVGGSIDGGISAVGPWGTAAGCCTGSPGGGGSTVTAGRRGISSTWKICAGRSCSL